MSVPTEYGFTMTHIVISDIVDEEAAAQEMPQKLYLKPLLTGLAGSKAENVIRMFRTTVWLTLVLDVVLFYNLSFVGKTLFYTLVILAAKLTFIVGVGVLYSLVQNFLSSGEIDRGYARNKSTDLSSSLIVTWLFSSIIMLFSVCGMKIWGPPNSDISNYLLWIIADLEFDSYVNFFLQFFISGLIGLVSVIAIFQAKIVFKSWNYNTCPYRNYLSLGAVIFWGSCILLISTMQAFTLGIWFVF